jgi:pimeloyl-ACP methyl ester carboxylesterase
MEFEREWTNTASGVMHARVGGDPGSRPPVVLIHGLVISSRYMVPTAAELAPLVRVYAVDLPGYGDSVKPHTLHGRLDEPHMRPIYEHFHDVPLVSISDAQREPLRELGMRWLGTVYHGCPLARSRSRPKAVHIWPSSDASLRRRPPVPTRRPGSERTTCRFRCG